MKKVLDNLYMFESKTNVLLYINSSECYLIDSGKSNKMKEEIKKYLSDNNLKLTGIINTHCHSDHVSNNDITDCKIYASKLEKTIIENSSIQLDLLYGGRHPKFMEESFVASKSFKASDLKKINNIEYIYFPGHSYNMVGVLIEDKVLCIGDAIFSKDELTKIPYVYDVQKFIDSLNELGKYNDKTVISSHCGIIDNLNELIDMNLSYIKKLLNEILSVCKTKKTFDVILETICKDKNIELNNNNYFIISSTIKSFISCLIDNDLLDTKFDDYNLYYICK